jgi:hypothetical protein
MNIVWDAPPRRGLEASARRGILALGLVLLGAAAVVVGLIASVILGGISDALSSRGLIDAVADTVSSLLSALILGGLVKVTGGQCCDRACGAERLRCAAVKHPSVLGMSSWSLHPSTWMKLLVSG